MIQPDLTCKPTNVPSSSHSSGFLVLTYYQYILISPQWGWPAAHGCFAYLADELSGLSCLLDVQGFGNFPSDALHPVQI